MALTCTSRHVPDVVVDLAALERPAKVRIVEESDDDRHVGPFGVSELVQSSDRIALEKHVLVDLDEMRGLAPIEHQLQLGRERRHLIDDLQAGAYVLRLEVRHAVGERRGPR